jgi:hypothetical protein
VADARGVPGFVSRIERATKGLPRREPGFDIDAYNERQIARRRDRPFDELLSEFRANLDADVADIQELDDAFLQQRLPDVRGDVGVVSDQMRAYLGGHPMRHLDDIEKALEAREA